MRAHHIKRDACFQHTEMQVVQSHCMKLNAGEDMLEIISVRILSFMLIDSMSKMVSKWMEGL